MSTEGPYLIIAAFWQDADNIDEVARAVGRDVFPQPDGYPRGAVVSFRREVALAHDFQHDLRKFDLPEVFTFPPEITAREREDVSTHSERTA